MKRLKKIKKLIANSFVVTELFAFIGFLIIRIYSFFIRVNIEIHPETQKLIDENKNFLTGFWEGRQIIFVPYFAKYRVCVLVDESWVGRILIRILHYFGYKTVSGSVKRKGVSAAINLKKMAENGYRIAFSLDGPRGPAFKSKPGIIFISRKLGIPIVPVATSAKRKWILTQTWCRYMIPKPFTKCFISIGKPLSVKEMADLTTKKLDEIINRHTEYTDKRCENL